MARMGSRIPVCEWTQVIPTTRVAGFTPARMRPTISSTVAFAGSANRGIFRNVAPVRWAAYSIAVVRAVIVMGGEDLLAGLEREPVVDEREAGGGVLGEADLLRFSAEIGGGGLADPALDVPRLALEQAPVETVNGFSSMARRQDSMASRTGAGCEAMKKPAKWRYSLERRNRPRTLAQSSSVGVGGVAASSAARSRPGTRTAPAAAPWTARNARRERVISASGVAKPAAYAAVRTLSHLSGRRP